MEPEPIDAILRQLAEISRDQADEATFAHMRRVRLAVRRWKEAGASGEIPYLDELQEWGIALPSTPIDQDHAPAEITAGIEEIRRHAQSARDGKHLPDMHRAFADATVLQSRCVGTTLAQEADGLVSEIARLRAELRDKLGVPSDLAVGGDHRGVYKAAREAMEDRVPVLVDAGGLLGEIDAEVETRRLFGAFRLRFLDGLRSLTTQRLATAKQQQIENPELALATLQDAYDRLTDDVLTLDDKETLAPERDLVERDQQAVGLRLERYGQAQENVLAARAQLSAPPEERLRLLEEAKTIYPDYPDLDTFIRGVHVDLAAQAANGLRSAMATAEGQMLANNFEEALRTLRQARETTHLQVPDVPSHAALAEALDEAGAQESRINQAKQAHANQMTQLHEAQREERKRRLWQWLRRWGIALATLLALVSLAFIGLQLHELRLWFEWTEPVSGAQATTLASHETRLARVEHRLSTAERGLEKAGGQLDALAKYTETLELELETLDQRIEELPTPVDVTAIATRLSEPTTPVATVEQATPTPEVRTLSITVTLVGSEPFYDLPVILVSPPDGWTLQADGELTAVDPDGASWSLLLVANDVVQAGSATTDEETGAVLWTPDESDPPLPAGTYQMYWRAQSTAHPARALESDSVYLTVQPITETTTLLQAGCRSEPQRNIDLISPEPTFGGLEVMGWTQTRKADGTIDPDSSAPFLYARVAGTRTICLVWNHADYVDPVIADAKALKVIILE